MTGVIGNKKIIGLLITKLHDLDRSTMIDLIKEECALAGYKLLVFNSFVDFYNNDAFDQGARSVYDLINLSMLDGLIIHKECFFNQGLINDVVDRAIAAGVPVVMINGRRDGCFSVMGRFEEAFDQLLDHVFGHHGVTDSVFMAGFKNDPISNERINCYRAALERYGLPFSDSQVYYGGYWHMPTMEAMKRLMAARDGKPPQAIICANDVMARTVCDHLNACGFKLPGDVIVTGYDGLPESELFSPELTTCSENAAGMAKLCVQAITEGLEGNPARELHNSYQLVISESCGCEKQYQGDYREMAREQYQTMVSMETHETQMFVWMYRMLSITDMNSLYRTLSGILLPNSYMCLRSEFLANTFDPTRMRNGYQPGDEMVVIPSVHNLDQVSRNSTLTVEQLLPYVDRWLENNNMYILNAVYEKENVCGYYVYETERVRIGRHNLKRVQNCLNIAFSITINHFRQATLQRSVDRAAMINSVTGLPNLKGAVEWYQTFAAEEGMRKHVSVSVYGMPKYTYIVENYGLKDGEEAQRFVAESLKLANPMSCFIAHISEDTFIVVNYYDDNADVDPTINRATSTFYSVIEGFNKRSNKEYYIEVNAGCTVVGPGWEGQIESLIKFANSDMIMNRLKLGMGQVVKEEVSPREHYRAFEMLVNKNLFQYHFQPIVNAKNGEIYGHEALMRTDASIGLNPLEILSAAREYGRLYDIEKATLFNVMSVFAKRRSEFAGGKVFINTIPGHFLTEEDLSALIKVHGSYMDHFVFELTEQESMSDEDLHSLRRLGGIEGESQIAIDDYGSGHSNIVNLLRYSPQVIKIDRFLVSEICKNQNKQLFVRNTVEFAKLNGILTLAEGVETSNELHMLIDLGVDLIQGYYTGRPQPDPIQELPPEIKQEILDANPLYR